MHALTGTDYGLPRAPGHRQQATLRVLTFGRPDADALVVVAEPECNGSMTCPCGACDARRAERRKLVQLRKPEDDCPWVPRAPRRRALREAA